MSKISINFTLPEDQDEYNIVHRARALHTVAVEFTRSLREYTKYAAPSKKVSWGEVSRLWWSILEDEGIDPYEV